MKIFISDFFLKGPLFNAVVKLVCMSLLQRKTKEWKQIYFPLSSSCFPQILYLSHKYVFGKHFRLPYIVQLIIFFSFIFYTTSVPGYYFCWASEFLNVRLYEKMTFVYWKFLDKQLDLYTRKAALLTANNANPRSFHGHIRQAANL